MSNSQHKIITTLSAPPITDQYSVMWPATDQSELSIQSGDQWQPGLRLRMSSLQFYINPIIRHNSGANQNVIFHTWKYACVTGVKIICSSLENYWWQNLFRLATNLIISVLKTSICIACKQNINPYKIKKSSACKVNIFYESELFCAQNSTLMKQMTAEVRQQCCWLLFTAELKSLIWWWILFTQSSHTLDSALLRVNNPVSTSHSLIGHT